MPSGPSRPRPLAPEQYNFQHSELQSKKEKRDGLVRKGRQEADDRSRSLKASRDMLRRLREDSSRNDAGRDTHGSLTAEQRRLRLERAVAEGGEDFVRSLPDLIEMRAARAEEEARGAEARCAAMRRVIAGYQNALGASSFDVAQQRGGGGGGAVLQQ